MIDCTSSATANSLELSASVVAQATIDKSE